MFKDDHLKSSSTSSTSSQDVNKADTHKTSRKGEGDKHKGKTPASSRPGQKQETVMYYKNTVTEHSKPPAHSVTK